MLFRSITFIDSDDKIAHEILNKAYTEIDVSSDIVVYDEINKKNTCTKIDDTLRTNLKKSILTQEKINLLGEKYTFSPTPWGKIYRTDIIKKNDVRFPLNVYIGEDMIFNLRLILVADSICFSRSVFYSYENNPSSLTKSFSINLADNLYAFIDEVEYLIDDRLFNKLLPEFIITDALRGVISKKDKSELDRIAKLIKIKTPSLDGLDNKRKVLFFLIEKKMWKIISMLITVRNKF